MLALLQRVTHAKVTINNQMVGNIEQGILIFIAMEPNDTKQKVERLSDRILSYRMFADKNDRMNLSVKDINGGLLIIPQFTLAADTSSGLRPSFTTAANPDLGKTLFNYFLDVIKIKYDKIASGVFGANMQITLTNDGPTTFILKQ